MSILGGLRNEADLDAWVAVVRKAVLDKLTDGPVQLLNCTKMQFYIYKICYLMQYIISLCCTKEQNHEVELL